LISDLVAPVGNLVALIGCIPARMTDHIGIL
jgi:hypothetical protein